MNKLPNGPFSKVKKHLSNANVASLGMTSKNMKSKCIMTGRYKRKYTRPIKTIQKAISNKLSYPNTVIVDATNTTDPFNVQSMQKVFRKNDLIILHKYIGNYEQYIYGRVKKFIKLNQRINFELYPEFIVSRDFKPEFYFQMLHDKEQIKTNRFTESKYNILHV